MQGVYIPIFGMHIVFLFKYTFLELPINRFYNSRAPTHCQYLCNFVPNYMEANTYLSQKSSFVYYECISSDNTHQLTTLKQHKMSTNVYNEWSYPHFSLISTGFNVPCRINYIKQPMQYIQHVMNTNGK